MKLSKKIDKHVDVEKDKTKSVIEEREKVQLKIKHQLLWGVLGYLPHLQFFKPDVDLAWEKVAIWVRNTNPLSGCEYSRDDITLNGMFMKKTYEKFMNEFLKNSSSVTQRSYSKVCDLRLLYKILELNHSNFEFWSNLAKENFEKVQTQRFREVMFKIQGPIPTTLDSKINQIVELTNELELQVRKNNELSENIKGLSKINEELKSEIKYK